MKSAPSEPTGTQASFQKTGKDMSNGLSENLLAALLSVVTVMAIKFISEGKISNEDVYVALGSLFPLLILTFLLYHRTRYRNVNTTKNTIPPTPQPFKGNSLLTILLWAILPAFLIPLIFCLITGRNVLFTGLLISESSLNPQDTISEVFNEQTGALLVDPSPLLQISAVRYTFADNTAQEQRVVSVFSQRSFDTLPVEQEKEGWKVRLEKLLDEGYVQTTNIVSVPQKIDIVVRHSLPSDNTVVIYVITDEVYPQQIARQILPFRETLIFQNIYVGQLGVINFMNVNNFSVTSASSPNIVQPGLGPIAAIVAVEFHDGKPIMRSDIVFVVRKGILHPNDIWFDKSLRPFISQPLGLSEQRMIAFQSPESGSKKNDIIISTLDGLKFTNIAFPSFIGSEEVICGWGKDEQNHNTLYFISSREGGNSKAPYKVVIANGTASQPIRLATLPQACEESP